jgi:hypothetical protein
VDGKTKRKGKKKEKRGKRRKYMESECVVCFFL